MHLIDVLIATLVLFPWLTEGIAFEIPGFHFIELPDLGIPFLIVALVALTVRRWSQTGSWKSFLALHGTRVVQPWFLGFDRSLARIIAGAAGLVGALFLLALVWRYWAFEDLGFDLGVAIWTLTRGTGSVLLVAIVAVALRRWSGEPWEKSFFIRQANRLAQAWRRAVDRSPARSLWSAAGVVGALLLWVSLLRHGAFETHGYDLGIFTNAIWNLTHGYGYVSSIKGGINLFADHQSPLFWLLAPLFWLVPRPETLLFAQAFGLAAGGPALYYLARAQFGRETWAPPALPWLYWTYLPLRNANAFDFHPEVFMLPLFLWAFAAFRSGHRWAKALGVLAFVAALGAKESAGVVAAGIGVGWALSSGAGSRRDRWLGVALAAVGVAVFFFDVKVVPRFFGGDYAYMNLYERFGDGLGDLLLAPFTQPGYFFSQLLNRERLNFLFWTLAPLAFLPLFDWRAAVAALPSYLMLFLSEGDQRVRIVFHYGIEPGTALFWALPLGLAAFVRRFGWNRAGVWMLVWIVAAHGPTEVARARGFVQSLHAKWLAAEVVPCLNSEMATAASDSLIPHLATRSWIGYPDQLGQRPPADPVRCVVTDLSVDNWPLGRRGVQQLRAGLPDLGYHEVWRCHELRVHQMGASGCLRCVPKCY